MREIRASRRTAGRILQKWQLYVLLLPALAWLAVFAYYPMYGLVIAFKDYKGRMGIMGSPWADPVFKYFETFFSTSIAVNAIWNTVAVSLLTLVIGFPIPIIFALLLNQIQKQRLRKTIQTISYAPYFLSTVIIVSIISMLFSANGVVNNVITGLGGEEVFFTSLPEWFRPLYIGSSVWQTMGFNAIIFRAGRYQPGLLRGGNCGRRHAVPAHPAHRHSADSADDHSDADPECRQHHERRLREGVPDAEQYEHDGQRADFHLCVQGGLAAGAVQLCHGGRLV